jgi:ribosome maturation factor RimP
LQEKIEKLAKQTCDELNLILVEVRIRGDRRQPIFEIFADTETGITLKECEILTRDLQDRIDTDESFYENYRLNVSSPGLDRPLTHDFEYKRNIGQQLSIKLQTAEGTIEKIGELTGFDEKNLQMLENGKSETINRSDIKEAKVKIKW